MRRWAWILGGLIIWTVHFAGVYAIASLADVVSEADNAAWRMTGLAFSAACVVAALTLTALAAQRWRASPEPETRFRNQMACLGAGLAPVAIVWQALPTLVGY